MGHLFQSLNQLHFLEILNLYSQENLSQVVDSVLEVGQTSVILENFGVWGNDKLAMFAEGSNIYLVYLPIYLVFTSDLWCTFGL